MRVIGKAVLWILFIYLLGCAHQAKNVGEWIPMTDKLANRENLYLEKHDILKPSQLFSGMAVWELSPLLSEPPVVFHWNGIELKYWKPSDTGVDIFKVDYSSCSELNKVLVQLEFSIGESVARMTDDKVWAERKIVVSPTFYKLKYFPEDMLGSVSLTNIEYDRVQWIPAAKKVLSVIEDCLVNQSD